MVVPLTAGSGPRSLASASIPFRWALWMCVPRWAQVTQAQSGVSPVEMSGLGNRSTPCLPLLACWYRECVTSRVAVNTVLLLSCTCLLARTSNAYVCCGICVLDVVVTFVCFVSRPLRWRFMFASMTWHLCRVRRC